MKLAAYLFAGFTFATALDTLPPIFGIGLVLSIVAGLIYLMIKLVKGN